jgi:hypothetical protein
MMHAQESLEKFAQSIAVYGLGGGQPCLLLTESRNGGKPHEETECTMRMGFKENRQGFREIQGTGFQEL